MWHCGCVRSSPPGTTRTATREWDIYTQRNIRGRLSTVRQLLNTGGQLGCSMWGFYTKWAKNGQGSPSPTVTLGRVTRLVKKIGQVSNKRTGNWHYHNIISLEINQQIGKAGKVRTNGQWPGLQIFRVTPPPRSQK